MNDGATGAKNHHDGNVYDVKMNFPCASLLLSFYSTISMEA